MPLKEYKNFVEKDDFKIQGKSIEEIEKFV
jgi:hypothetical protein